MKRTVAEKKFVDRRLHPRERVILQSAATMSAAMPPQVETGFLDVDRFLGGGIYMGSKMILGGVQGTGKSTLATQIALCLGKRNHMTLWVAGEECPQVCRARADRLGGTRDAMRKLFFTEQCAIEDILELIYEHEPTLVIFDSLQKIYSRHCKGATGGPQQLRAITDALKLVPDEVGYLFLSQTNKAGRYAGTQAVLHEMDQLMWVSKDEVEPTQVALRWAGKNRLGSANTESLLFMTPRGFMTYDKMKAEEGNPFIEAKEDSSED